VLDPRAVRWAIPQESGSPRAITTDPRAFKIFDSHGFLDSACRFHSLYARMPLQASVSDVLSGFAMRIRRLLDELTIDRQVCTQYSQTSRIARLTPIRPGSSQQCQKPFSVLACACVLLRAWLACFYALRLASTLLGLRAPALTASSLPLHAPQTSRPSQLLVHEIGPPDHLSAHAPRG